jgi:hypothetical protein
MMAWLATAAGPVRAQDEVSKVPVPRSESLELPGLTAGCHICEWRPKLNQMPADEECGADQSGNAKIGLFECGFSQDCKRECRFLRCGPL